MATSLTIRDETASGQTVHQLSLDLLTETITVGELIRSRVYQEVKDYNLRQPREFRGLVQPTGAEPTPSGYRLEQSRQIDWKEQYEKSIAAFQAGQILILVDDRQAESLDQEITVGSDTDVAFLRLTMLVGG